MKPTIYIDLVKNLPRMFPGRRPQPFRYFVRDAGNHAMYEKSSEALTNRGDAITAIEDVHGPHATVVLREHGNPDRVLRQPVSRRVVLTDDQVDRVMALTSERIVNSPFANRHALRQTIEILNEVIA